MPIVKNKRTDVLLPGVDVLIMRPTKWGNPFYLGLHGDRATVLFRFRTWLETGENFNNVFATEEARQAILQNIRKLKGKDLICQCSPLPCHGDILLELANKE